MSYKKTGSGSFPVNMTDREFHVGRTSVSYSVNSNNNTVTYQLFINNGFWDTDFNDERYAHYFSTSSDFIPDGKWPNFERFGGTPYDYIPVNIIYLIVRSELWIILIWLWDKYQLYNFIEILNQTKQK